MQSFGAIGNTPYHSSATSLRADLLGGLTTFLTMAYIVVVNSSILATHGTGLPFAGVMTATILLAAGMSILMCVYAKLPFGVAPGMGLNAFLAFSVILGREIPWPIAMGLVFWAGVFFLLLSILPVRMAIVGAIPVHLRSAAAMGIGLFLAFIGLKNAGLVGGRSRDLRLIWSLDIIEQAGCPGALHHGRTAAEGLACCLSARYDHRDSARL